MSTEKLEDMSEYGISLDLISLRTELDDVVKEQKIGTAFNQDFPMQIDPPLCESAFGFDVTEFFQGATFPMLTVDSTAVSSTVLSQDDCSLMHTLNVSTDLMEIAPQTFHGSPVTVPDPIPITTETVAPLYITPSCKISHAVLSNPVTPTSGPTPVMTPINSMPSSPTGSLYSGYSSGWGPPSPPGRRANRKKRGVPRTRARGNADCCVTNYTNITPITSPRTSVSTSPNEATSANRSVANSTKDLQQNIENSRHLPRHKRPSHIRAEHKRRNKIQTGIEDLKDLVPAVAEVCQKGGKESKAAILAKTVEHCRELRQETKERAREIQKLQGELESLTLCINEVQQQLPEEGAGIEMHQTKPSQDIKQMFQDYVSSRTFGNWKFWIFGMVMTPLFESYNNSVITSDREQFCSSVLSWLDTTCSLVSLRPVVFKALRNLSKKTSIMTNPENLRQEALKEVMHTNFANQKEVSL